MFNSMYFYRFDPQQYFSAIRIACSVLSTESGVHPNRWSHILAKTFRLKFLFSEFTEQQKKELRQKWNLQFSFLLVPNAGDRFPLISPHFLLKMSCLYNFSILIAWKLCWLFFFIFHFFSSEKAASGYA